MALCGSVMKLSVLKQDEATGNLFLELMHGPLAGQRFRTLFSTCSNPCCACIAVGFSCSSMDTILRNDREVKPPTMQFKLDVVRRKFMPREESRQDSESSQLGNAVVSELQENDWIELWRYLQESKDKQIREADVQAIDATFPPEVLAGTGGFMAGYVEIFPLACGFSATVDDGMWTTDDQY